MIHVISQNARHLYGAAIERMFVARRALYVEGVGWDGVAGDDGWDTDKFDHDDAVYLVGPDESALYSCRLIPSTSPNLISGKLTQLADFTPRPRSDLWVLDRWLCPEDNISAGLEMATGVMEFAHRHAITSFTAVGGEELGRRLGARGWQCDLLGSAGTTCLALVAAGQDALATSRKLANISGSVLLDAPPQAALSDHSASEVAARSLIDEIWHFVESEPADSLDVIQDLHASFAQQKQARSS